MKAFRLLLLVLLLTGVGHRAAQAQRPVQVDLDHAAFAYDASQALLELYLAFEAVTLPYEPADDGYQALLPVNLTLRHSSQKVLAGTPNTPVWQDSLLLRFAMADTSQLAPGQLFVHQLRTSVPPGEYEMNLVVPADAARQRQRLELRHDVLVPDFAQTGLVGLSDITLSSGIQPSDDRQNPFYKNGLLIQPNANQLYGQGLNQLFYYAEAYHTAGAAGDDGQYTLYSYISEANRPQPVGDLQRRVRREARNPDVLVGAFDLGKVPSGAYFLRLVLLNDKNEAVAEQSRKFFVFNPDVARAQVVGYEASFENSPYATMTAEEVDREFGYIGIIASDRERRRFRNIEDLDERRRFLMEFWRQRDPQPATPVNEFRDAFYQRLQYANERYASNREEGWQSERGRVIVKYGVPSSIEPHLYERDTAPYELWVYHGIPGEGQALFVFADRDGFGRFELIHSTVSGERSLPNWQQQIRK